MFQYQPSFCSVVAETLCEIKQLKFLLSVTWLHSLFFPVHNLQVHICKETKISNIVAVCKIRQEACFPTKPKSPATNTAENKNLFQGRATCSSLYPS